MPIDPEAIFDEMMDAAEGAFQDGWNTIKIYAPAEFKKMALQLAEIAENVALYKLDPAKGYSVETGKLLFSMQRTACEGVFVALTQLTLITVQKALDAIMDVLRKAFAGIIAAIIP